ncbi:hypothetical protein FDP41_003170 [Naegleria fowleri]|uniref:BRCT domain-containing protein n=1 Tax=Naegleria fowleri TaxID=5763 RepID=A0A6A5BV96_NAEFO|nr:uncharacterized protein FDP41_003170 [Naegleria fowleri]KAF0977848.1 hypothetical protein FDP41_003170 [Naegleria fowleri]
MAPKKQTKKKDAEETNEEKEMTTSEEAQSDNDMKVDLNLSDTEMEEASSKSKASSSSKTKKEDSKKKTATSSKSSSSKKESKKESKNKDGVFKGLDFLVGISDETTGADSSDAITESLSNEGGNVMKKISDKIKYLVFLKGKPATYKNAKEKGIKIVNPLWVKDCISKKKILEVESKYEPEEPESGKRKKDDDNEKKKNNSKKKETKKKEDENKDDGEEEEDSETKEPENKKKKTESSSSKSKASSSKASKSTEEEDGKKKSSKPTSKTSTKDDKDKEKKSSDKETSEKKTDTKKDPKSKKTDTTKKKEEEKKDEKEKSETKKKDETKKPKDEKKKDDKKLKRPPSAYNLFMADKKKENKSTELSEISNMWKELSEDKKKSYVEQAEKLKEEYLKNNPDAGKKTSKPKKEVYEGESDEDEEDDEYFDNDGADAIDDEGHVTRFDFTGFDIQAPICEIKKPPKGKYVLEMSSVAESDKIKIISAMQEKVLVEPKDGESPKLDEKSSKPRMKRLLADFSWATTCDPHTMNFEEYNGQYFTHLIVPKEEKTRRTIKILFAIAFGAHIVNVDWFYACEKEGKKVNETPYLVDVSPACEKSRAILLSEEERMKRKPRRSKSGDEDDDMEDEKKGPSKLLADTKIIVSSCTNPPAKYLKRLIELLGGSVVTSARTASYHILSKDEKFKEPKVKSLTVELEGGHTIEKVPDPVIGVTEKWLLDAITNYEIPSDVTPYLVEIEKEESPKPTSKKSAKSTPKSSSKKTSSSAEEKKDDKKKKESQDKKNDDDDATDDDKAQMDVDEEVTY